LYSSVRKFDRKLQTTVEIARVQDGQVFGPEAIRIKELLIDGGWPGKPAHHVLCGTFLYASEPIEGNAF